MKLASVRLGDESLYGIVTTDSIQLPAAEFIARYPDLKSVLGAAALGELSGAVGARNIPLADVTFEPLIPNPDKLLCVGINFRAHMAEMERPEPEHPWMFVRFAASQVGHKQPLLHPGITEKFDFEGELAFVIGKTAHRVKAADALDYVAGYSCFMDGSVRDWQRHSSQFTPGKNFYQSGSFGPWLVTADEIPEPSKLNLETRLNGEVMQQAELSDLKFDIPALIEYCSTFAKLEPGDVISTGTPGGVGFARDPQVWLKPGDTIEVEVDRIGVLSNTVA
jgi:2-keto-4-pentenoate hydratase/2-oxohepta-3-ene-1,7-dioic acid hydratase in catechol pathway